MTAVAVTARAVTTAERLRTRAWIVAWWATGRALVLATTGIVYLIGPRGLTGHDERTGAIGLLGVWDGRWYRTVAENGYLLLPGRQSDPAFFPLYPLLLRGMHALGAGYLVGGVLLSNIALLGALVAFEALTRELFGARFARRSTIYVALFPLGFVFSMAYPESIVLCAIALAAIAALRRRWLTAAALAAAGTLARPETLFVAVPFLALALREHGPRARGVALGAVAAPLAALASFALYLAGTLHDPLAWTHAERAWGRQFTPFGLVTAIEHLPRAVAGDAWVLRDVVCFVLYLVLLGLALHAGAPRAWVVAGAAVVVLPTFSGSFHSIGRFGLLAPAVFWGLAALGTSGRRDLAIRVVSAGLLVAGTTTIPFIFP